MPRDNQLDTSPDRVIHSARSPASAIGEPLTTQQQLAGAPMSAHSAIPQESLIVYAARIAHEVNRTYCTSIGDVVPPPWVDCNGQQRCSMIDGVRFVVENPKATCEDQHDNWLRGKHADGWTWGPVKDVEARRHPNMKAYNELPKEQRAKDALFRTVVREVLSL